MKLPDASATIVTVSNVGEGIERLYEVADGERSNPLLVVAAIDFSRDDLGVAGHDLIALATVTGVETPATLAGSRWRGGPVLTVGLEPDALEAVACDRRVSLVLAIRSSGTVAR